MEDDRIVNGVLRIAECLERMVEEARADRQLFREALENISRVVK